jgi:hypothetical protein
MVIAFKAIAWRSLADNFSARAFAAFRPDLDENSHVARGGVLTFARSGKDFSRFCQ